MALINYVEPISIGGIFVGIGSLILCIVVASIFYKIYGKLAQYVEVIFNRESKYELLEEKYLDKIAKKEGFDLQGELIKRDMFKKKTKSFRNKLEEQVFEEMFGKEKDKDDK